jgi:hypothetical protein
MPTPARKLEAADEQAIQKLQTFSAGVKEQVAQRETPLENSSSYVTEAQKAEIIAQRQETSTTLRATVPALEEILYQPLPVLDHGFVRVIDYMGDDSAVVQAARVSYGKGTKKVSEDAGLFKYLMRHWH